MKSNKKTFENEKPFYPTLYKNPENTYLFEAKISREKEKIYRLYDKKTGFFKEPKKKKEEEKEKKEEKKEE